MEFDCVIVLTTVPAGANAHQLAATLVDERLAACVNVLGEMESVYRWKGEIATDRERQVVIKTTHGRLAALKARLHELHEYEVPEFIEISTAGGSEAYLGWIRESVAG